MAKERIIFVDRERVKTITQAPKVVYKTIYRDRISGPSSSSSGSTNDEEIGCFGCLFAIVFWVLVICGLMWIAGVWIEHTESLHYDLGPYRVSP